MKIVFSCIPTTKKNSPRIVYAGKYPKLLPSKQYMQHRSECIAQLRPEQCIGLDTPVNLKALYYMPSRRRVDLVNLLEATCDILVDGGVLRDDNCKIVAGHDGSRVLYDKENPRVEITITPIQEV